MRHIQPNQLQLGEIDIAAIQLDPKSRDDIPQILRGLQYLYANEEIRSEMFRVLEELIPSGVDAENGRPGLSLWKILVMGTLRLNLNWDYDRLQEIVNHHRTIRQMLGHGLRDEEDQYKLQTLKDNISLFTPEILDKLNKVVVAAGHKAIKKKPSEEPLKGRCDSFVVETHVHYPTDINLLWDAIRKMVSLVALLSGTSGLTLWRQWAFNLKQFKKLYRKAQKAKHSTSKNEQKHEAQKEAVIQAHKDYLVVARELVAKTRMTLPMIESLTPATTLRKIELERFIAHAERQIDQIERRVIHGEKIPHEEKVFSLFQEHTEWISKGKAGVPVELGLRTAIVEDQWGFILHHKVMENQTDDQVAVSMVVETQARFPNMTVCSFDKGFHSPDNQVALKDILDLAVLPKKGRLNQKEKEHENSDGFQKARCKHSAVESGINALEEHGLDRCPDHGIDGFKRYVALAVLARNIQKLGAELRKLERAAEKRKRAA